MNRYKLWLARGLAGLGADRALLRVRSWAGSPHVRAVNYHDVPPSRAADFARQLDFYARHFVSVDQEGLEALLADAWPHRRPGILLSFDDGLRSHAEVVAPLLEERGLAGWFMVPGGFLDAPPPDQAAYAATHMIQVAGQEYGDPRVAMTWEQARRLAGRHVVGCHTWDHVRLADRLGFSTLEAQIVGAKARLEKRLGSPVTIFAWVGGEEASYGRMAAELVAGAGFRFGFMTNHQVIRPGSQPLQLQRSNVEAHDPDPVLRFQLTGLMDLFYVLKRRRVNRLTAV